LVSSRDGDNVVVVNRRDDELHRRADLAVSGTNDNAEEQSYL
jgi:hypothetical protein